MLTFLNFEILIVVGIFCYVVYRTAIEIGISQYNPFIKLKPLSRAEEDVLAHNFVMYGRLPKAYRKKCNERIVWFRSKKSFVFYGDVAKT